MEQHKDDQQQQQVSSQAIALADLLKRLPKTVPLANDSAALRASYDLLKQAKDAVRDPGLPLLPKPPAPTDLAPLPLVQMIAGSVNRTSPSPSRGGPVAAANGDTEMR